MTICKAREWARYALMVGMLIFISGCGMNGQAPATLANPSPAPSAIAAIRVSPTQPPSMVTPTPIALDPEHWEHFYSPAEGSQVGFFDIAEATDGAMWFIGYSHSWKIYRYKAQDWTTYAPTDIPDFHGKIITALTSSPNGTVWVGTEKNEIVSFDGATWTSQTVEEGGYRGNAISSILIRRSGELCAVSIEGLSCQKAGRWNHYPIVIQDQVNGVHVFKAVMTPNENIWVPLSNGILYSYSGRTWEKYRINKWMGPIAASQDGSLWVFGGHAGLGRWSNAENMTYKELPGALWETLALSLYELNDGTVWYGCEGGVHGPGVVIYRKDGAFETVDGKILKRQNDHSLDGYRYPFDNVYHIFQSKDGVVWLATGNGIFLYHADK